MAQNETETKVWGDCERCGEENCVMPCHVERLHGEEDFLFRGALDEPFRGIAEVAEAHIGLGCAKCGFAGGPDDEED